MNVKYHTVVVGAGIAGMESALNLASQGYKVLLVEKEASIGGNMIALSKVYPTLDCASCITTPKMSEAYNNKNITIMTYSEVIKTEKKGADFFVTIRKKPRYVNEKTCIGCKKCEDVCPVYVPHEFDRGLGARKAVCIPFNTAMPQVAVLDPKTCMQCGKCYDACPTEPKSIVFDQKEEILGIECNSVIMATGYNLTPVDIKKEYYLGGPKNVITSFQLERVIAPSGPFGGAVRPGDGKEPSSIAFVLCAGSRDRSIGVPYCSRVCCMYSIKQAMLMSAALPMADISIYYMDIRAFGKSYEQFYRNAEAMGIKFIKAKVAKITEVEKGDLELNVEMMEETGTMKKIRHELVVLASGMVPGAKPSEIAPVSCDSYGFLNQPKMKYSPSETEADGLFSAGTITGPKDIVDTIAESGAAAMLASNYINKAGK